MSEIPKLGCVNHDCARCQAIATEESSAVQEPDDLRHIDEKDYLLDVDEKAWRSLVENRGGCRCHLSPPCGACSDPISEEELNEVGYTYTHPQPKAEQEPVAYMRMPKVGDRVVCIEDEDFGTVQSLTAGGSPDIKFDDGSYGTYLLREFAELFRYADTHSQPKAEGEHALEQALTRLQKRYSELESKVAAQPKAEQEPKCPDCGAVALYECVACSSNNYPKGFVQPKREWVGLTLADKEEYINQDFGGNRLDAMDWAEKRLKEKNT